MCVLLSSGCWGNYLPGCTCGSVRLIGSLCSCRLGAQGSAALDVSEHPFLRPDAVAPNRMRCISTQPYILLHACVIYMPPPPPLHTHTPFMSIFLTPQYWEKGSGSLRGGACWGKRLRSHLWHGAWGPTAQSPICCSSMWKMAGEQEEEGKEVKK